LESPPLNFVILYPSERPLKAAGPDTLPPFILTTN
jgi:hypothetical protein